MLYEPSFLRPLTGTLAFVDIQHATPVQMRALAHAVRRGRYLLHSPLWNGGVNVSGTLLYPMPVVEERDAVAENSGCLCPPHPKLFRYYSDIV